MHHFAYKYAVNIRPTTRIMAPDKLQSIIKLLDDPDESVFRALEQELLSQGAQVVKPLEDAWGQSEDQLVHRRIEHITHRIQLTGSVADFTAWAKSERHDLSEAAYIIARYQYPELDRIAFMGQMRQVADDVAKELVTGLTPLEKVRVLNHGIFREYQFDRSEYNAASFQWFYMNNVLAQKKGNLFTLCLLYAAIAQDVQLPLMALSLPENLTLAYVDTVTPADGQNPSSSLFYVNPFNRGAVFGSNEIRDFLTRAHYPIKDEFFTPISNLSFITLLMETIQLYYQQEKNEDKYHDLEHLISLLKKPTH